VTLPELFYCEGAIVVWMVQLANIAPPVVNLMAGLMRYAWTAIWNACGILRNLHSAKSRAT
jgi:hypothetical protein